MELNEGNERVMSDIVSPVRSDQQAMGSDIPVGFSQIFGSGDGSEQHLLQQNVISQTQTPLVPNIFVNVNRYREPIKFNGTGDIYEFLKRWNRTAIINGWGDKEKALHIENSLDGNAELWWNYYVKGLDGASANWKSIEKA